MVHLIGKALWSSNLLHSVNLSNVRYSCIKRLQVPNVKKASAISAHRHARGKMSVHNHNRLGLKVKVESAGSGESEPHSADFTKAQTLVRSTGRSQQATSRSLECCKRLMMGKDSF